MARHGGKTVFFGRFVSILRYTVAWVAGLARMPWWRFLFWNAAGGIVWATAVGLIALLRRTSSGTAIQRYGLYAGIAVVVVLIVGCSASATHAGASRNGSELTDDQLGATMLFDLEELRLQNREAAADRRTPGG